MVLETPWIITWRNRSSCVQILTTFGQIGSRPQSLEIKSLQLQLICDWPWESLGIWTMEARAKTCFQRGHKMSYMKRKKGMLRSCFPLVAACLLFPWGLSVTQPSDIPIKISPTTTRPLIPDVRGWHLRWLGWHSDYKGKEKRYAIWQAVNMGNFAPPQPVSLLQKLCPRHHMLN